MRNFILFLLLVSFTSAYSQYAKVNFILKAEIERYQNQPQIFSIIVRGNVAEIKKEVIALRGSVGLSSGNIVQVKLLSNLITSFSKKKFVQSIEYSGSKVRVLNDTLTINNNVPPVISGNAPLISPYTGKGVIFGLIDTGIDIDHPDFKDTLGNTRILRIWDQNEPDNGTSTYGYGIVWDSTDINNNTSTHKDDFSYLGHGTHVTGIGTSNGLAVNNYTGVAPEANIVVVAVDFSSTQSTILDAVDYIYNIADSFGMPCVLNVSLGDYPGSHDGTDGTAILIDGLINQKPGRAFVCAAGNAGVIPFHLQHQVNSDTTFTWFTYNPDTTLLGYGAVFYEIWADTADLNNVSFSIGANLPSGSFNFRGNTPFDNIQNRLGNRTDTIKNNGNIIGIVDTYGELQGDKYLLQINLQEPDSNTYYFSLMTTGSGKLDVWSHSNLGLIGSADMVKTGLPTPAIYPNIIYYQEPDTSQTIVSSFTCLPSVLAVGSYVNRKTYLDVDSITQVVVETPGVIDIGSSIGPNRRGVIKPDIASTGRIVMSSTPDTVATYVIGIGAPQFVGFGGKHLLKNGTSMSSPAVAGIVALYLEKCPNATMAEVKAAITSSAKQDAFTGVTPNNSYGYGKADAFAALNISNYVLTLGADKNVCDGDSTQITAPSYASYTWSNGDTTQSIYLDTTGNAYVVVSNISGCIGFSDTVNVTWRPLPIKPIITLVGNDTLIYTTSLNLQWYFNTSTIGGEIDTIHIAQNNGDYFVQVTDSFGCKNNSDTVAVVGVGIENIENSPFSIYPNPTNGKIIIAFGDNKLNSIAVINLLGKIMLEKQDLTQQTKLELDLTNFAEGVYYIRLNTKDKQYLHKLILLR